MTTQHDRRSNRAITDAAIASMFAQRARRADASDLRGPILTATMSVEQHGTWQSRFRTIARPGRARGPVLVFIALTLAALAVVATGALRSDLPPKSTTTGFVPRFEYIIPIGSDLRPSAGGPTSQIIAWIAGPEPRSTTSDPRLYGDQQPETGSLGGIIVAAGKSPWSHSASGRFLLRTTPAGFLDDLRATAEVPMGEVAETTLDGRPAIAARLLASASNDIHVTGSTTGLTGGGGFVLLNGPARITVAEVDGWTLFILAWARTDEDLDAWMPTADVFISSMHFLPEEGPS
jgi:hypothetical protein